MRFMEDPAGCDPVASLGFDVLAGVPPVEELAQALAKRRIAIKSALLDQARGFALMLYRLKQIVTLSFNICL